MDKIKWHTETRKWKDLILFDRNPRTMSEKQVSDLRASINKFDIAEIPAIDIDNVVVAGNQRTTLMQLDGHGEEETDVRVPNRKLTEEEFMEYNLRSNKNTGDFDWNLLAHEDIDFLKEVGFDEKEIFKGLGIDVPTEEDDVDITQSFEVVVEAKNEMEQQEIYNKLIQQGFICRLITI